MSLTVLLIGLVHAIPTLVIAVLTKSLIPVTLTALVMSVVAIGTGAPQYAIVDLGFVGFTYYLVLQHRKGAPQSQTRSNSIRTSLWLGAVLVGVGLALGVFVGLFDQPAPQHVMQPIPQHQTLPTPASSAAGFPVAPEPLGIQPQMTITRSTSNSTEQERRTATMQ